MSKKRLLFFISYFSLLFFILVINSKIIIKLLNKSLFPDFTIQIEQISNSFYNGAFFIFLSFLLIFSIVGSIITTLLIANMLWGGFIVANSIKVQERNEFITFSELQTITSPKELLSFVDISVGYAVLIFISLILFLIGLHFVIVKISKKANILLNKKLRVGLFVGALIPLLFIFIYPNSYNQHILKYEETNSHNFNPVNRARKDGFLPSFLHTVKPEYMEKPKHYSKVNVQKIFNKYYESALNINKNRKESLENSQTFLYLSESLINPDRIPYLLSNGTPIPYMADVSKRNIGGTMYSQYIGGGTANIEWSILTSFSLEVFNEPMAVTPYSDFYAQSKNHHTVLSFYEKEKVAIHPYTAHLYKRRTIYDKIGFDDFLYLDHGIEHTDKLGTHIRVSDESLHKDILRVANNSDVGLIHVLTMQNHSPYNQEIPEMAYQPEINTDVYTLNDVDGLFNYLQGVKASDEAVQQLISTFEELPQDINLLLYGDHFPSVFRGLEDQLGEKVNETPWLIYMNNGRSEKEIQLEGLSPVFLITVLLREGNYFVSPFQALMDELLTQGVRRIGNDFIITIDGKLKDNDLSTDLLEMIDDYRIIVYDALFGPAWLSDEFFTVSH